MNQVSLVDATITRVGKYKFKVRSREKGLVADVHTFNNFPLNRGAFIDSRPLVKKDDKDLRGQLLANTNYTMEAKLALGINLNTAVMPSKGETHH